MEKYRFKTCPQDRLIKPSKTQDLRLNKTFYKSGDERLADKLGFELTEKVIRLFSEILSGIDDYAVISSTALYLRDKQAGQKSIRPPGDFDFVAFSETAFKKIIESLSKAGAVFTERDKKTPIKQASPVRVMPDHEAKVITGYLAVGLADEVVHYEFGVFSQTCG